MTYSKVLNGMIEICDDNAHALRADGRVELFVAAPIVEMVEVDQTKAMTKEELRHVLDDAGIEYDLNAKKGDLVELVKMIA